MAKVLVTGGAGFIGSNLTDALIGAGHEVSVIDNLSTGLQTNINKKARFFKRSITEPLDDIFREGKFEYIHHLAAQANVRKSLADPKEDALTNIIGSLNIIQCAKKFGVKKIIFSSTGGAIYAADAALPCSENSSTTPLSPYGISKMSVENYLRVMKDVFGLSSVCLRYSNVYGPRQNAKGEAGVIAIFIDSAIKNEPMKIFGNGEQTRDFVFVKDVVAANLKAWELEGTYNVSTGIETSVNEIVSGIISLLKTKTPVIHEKAVAGELLRNVLDNKKLQSTGWKPLYNLDKGLEITVDWFRKQSAHL